MEEILAENSGAIAAALAAVISVFATRELHRRQAIAAEKESGAAVEKIKNEVEVSLWQRARDELAEKDNEIAQLKAALNHLGVEHAAALERIRVLELRLDTGELKRK